MSRVRLIGVEALRHSILVVRDGEQESPRMAAVIAAVHAVNERLTGAPISPAAA